MSRVSGAVSVTFRSLRVRNFRLFFIGQLISQIGTWLTQIALTLLVLHLTHSGIAVGGLVACQFGPVLFFGAYGGVVADRADKRKLLLTTQTLQMLQSFALGFFAFMHNPPIAAFFITAVVGGFLLAFDNPARRSFVSEMVPADEVHNAVTLNTALMTSSRIFGPALAGLLVVTAGYGWAFTTDAISYLAVLAGLWMMRTKELYSAPRSVKAKGQVRDGVRYIRTVPELYVPLIMVTIVGTLTFNFSVTLPIFAEQTLHGTDGTFTLLYSVLSLGSFAGALVAAHRRSVEVRHVVTAAYWFGGAMFLFAASPNVLGAFPTSLLVGFTSIAFMTAATAIVQVHADPMKRGRVMAIQSMVMIGSTPIGGPLLGEVCDVFGARSALVIGGFGALAAGVWGRAKIKGGTASSAPADSTQLSELASRPLGVGSH
ncbi:MAG: arabinose efflux permease family protein [Acidimicrobiia bacterium]|nr:arabinose efflux permease family protein [Acidimicrobiia bacterium]